MDPTEQALYTKYGVDPTTHVLDKERGEFVPRSFTPTSVTTSPSQQSAGEGGPNVAPPAVAPTPKDEGPVGTVVRKYAGDIVPTLGSLPLMLRGAQLGMKAPGGPVVKGLASLATGIGAGALGHEGIGWMQHKAAEMVDPVMTAGYNRMEQINNEANPKAAIVGSLLSQATGMKLNNPVGLAKEVARGLSTIGLGSRALAPLAGPALNAGLSGGMEAMGEFDKSKPGFGLSPGRIGAATAGGALLGHPRSLVAKMGGVPAGPAPHIDDLINEARVAKTQGDVIQPPPVPEKPTSLIEQLKDTADPASSRRVVLVTPGESLAGLSLPQGMAVAKTKFGDVVYNPAKGVTPAFLKGLTGKGDFPGSLLGMSQDVKPKVAKALTSTQVNSQYAQDKTFVRDIVKAFGEGDMNLAQQLADALPEPTDNWTYKSTDLQHAKSYGEGNANFSRDLKVRGKSLWQWMNEVQNSHSDKEDARPITAAEQLDAAKNGPDANGPKQTVVSTKRNGVEVLSEVVDGSPESVKAAIEAHKKAVPGGMSEVVNPRAVIKQRLEQPELPLKPREAAANPGTQMEDLPLFKKGLAEEPKRNLGAIPSAEDLPTSADVPDPLTDLTQKETIYNTTKNAPEPEGAPQQEGLMFQKEEPVTTASTEGDEKVRQGWMDFWKKTALKKYAVDTKEQSGIKTFDNESATGMIDTAKREMSVDPSILTHDTQPHELFHQWANDVRSYGNKAEKAYLERTLKEFGGEEAATQAIGDHFVKRLDKRQDGVVRDLLDFIKYKTGRATKAELERLGSNIIARGRGSVDIEPNIKPTNPDGVMYRKRKDDAPTSAEPKQDAHPSSTPRPKFMSAVDALKRSTSDKLRSIGHAYNTTFANRREYIGKYERPVMDPMDKLTPEELKAYHDYLVYSHDANDTTPIEGSDNLKKAVQAFRETYHTVREDANKLGIKVTGRNGGEGREGKFDPTGMPHLLDPDVREMMHTQHDTKEWNDLHKKFVDYNVERAVAKAKPGQEARAAKDMQAIAEATWEEYTGAAPSKNEGANDAFYQAIHKVESTKLPPEMIDKNPRRLWEKYVGHTAADMALHKNIRSNPELAAMTGLVRDSNITSLAGHPQVKAAMEAYNPTLEETSALAKATQGGAGLITAGIVSNPVTRVGDMVSTPFRAAGLVGPMEIPGVVVQGIKNLAGAGERARDTGVIRNMDNYLGNMLGLTDHVNKHITQLLRGITKYTGSEAIERGARTVAQAFGEAVAQVHIHNALKGDKTALDFVQHLGNDWRELAKTPAGRDKLGSRVGLIVQGTFDGSNLPAWAMKGGVKPLVALGRWSIEQQNNFRKYQLDPLIKHGDVKPLLSHLAMMAAGGFAVAEVRELLSGKKSYQPTFKEIENAPDKARAWEALALKLGNYSQLMSTFGYMGDLITSVAQAAGGQPVNQINSPAVQFLNDVGQNTAAMIRAWADGEDMSKVIAKYAQDMATSHLSAARLIKNYWDKAGVTEGAREEDTAKNARRDYSVYKRLRGDTIRPFAPIPGYHNLGEQEFDRSKLDEAPGLMMREIDKQIKRNPAGLDKKLKSLATIADPAEGPSLKRKPDDWMSYVDYVGKTQGKSKADKLMLRLASKEEERDAKRQMVPK